MTDKTIGERIRDTRINAGLSQVELAQTVGITKQSLYKYETGIITNIPLERLERIAAALDVSPTYLMGWKEYDGSDYFGEKSRGKVWDVVENLVDNPDKQFDRVLDAWAQLNEEGHERVAEQAELLVVSGRYKKDGASRVVGDA